MLTRSCCAGVALFVRFARHSITGGHAVILAP